MTTMGQDRNRCHEVNSTQICGWRDSEVCGRPRMLIHEGQRTATISVNIYLIIYYTRVRLIACWKAPRLNLVQHFTNIRKRSKMIRDLLLWCTSVSIGCCGWKIKISTTLALRKQITDGVKIKLLGINLEELKLLAIRSANLSRSITIARSISITCWRCPDRTK